MKRGIPQLLCAAGIAGTSLITVVSAQSESLSGTWTGTVVADGSTGDRFNLVFSLKFAGNHISGTAGPSADNHNGTIAAGDPSGAEKRATGRRVSSSLRVLSAIPLSR